MFFSFNKIIFMSALFIVFSSSVNFSFAQSQEKLGVPPVVETELEKIGGARAAETDLEKLDAAEVVVSEDEKEWALYNQRLSIYDPKIKVDEIQSLFLTDSEEEQIVDARKGLVTRPPTDDEFAKEQRQGSDGAVGPRELSLSGILYVSADDWIIWLNSEKITPDNIPSEVIDVRVTRDYVRLKWFDVSTNQIFPIKLRTHQRFNLDTRIFLPG